MDKQEFSGRLSAVSGRLLIGLMEVIGRQEALAEKEGEDPEL
jgi:hypothetical protein